MRSTIEIANEAEQLLILVLCPTLDLGGQLGDWLQCLVEQGGPTIGPSSRPCTRYLPFVLARYRQHALENHLEEMA